MNGNRIENLVDLKVGQKVRIRQKIDRREGDWHTELVGTIREIRQQKTGSWFAHNRDNKVWLYRIHLQKESGEISVLTIDQWTQVELLSDVTRG